MERVTVIGGGVVGLATAYALVREGWQVDLVEARDSLASATSFANGGQLSYRYVAPLADAGVPWQALGWLLRGDSPLRLRLRLDTAQWRWLAAFVMACRTRVNRRNAAQLLDLALQSQAVLARWREEDGLDGFAWRRNGKLVAFRTQRAFEHGRQHLLDPDTQRVLNAADLRGLDPALTEAPFVGGVFTPDEEVADCHRFCLRLAEHLQASGQCRLLLGRPVTRLIARDERVVALELGGERLEVQRLVLSAGHRSVGLALPGLHLPVYPLKGYSLTAPVGATHRAPEVSITDYERKIVYARLEDQLRVAAMVDIVGYDEAVDAGRLASMRRLARETLPKAADYGQAVEWAGMRPATPTGVPIIEATRYRNLWLNLGHGALGFTLACGSGERLARLLR
ncbi:MULTISPECIES: D-amino acid dehydrogenase [unclassified Pseudomonas]|uniref:D-amino acid dehydrogenase n=2 Tax=Pseudomonas TaxID=286 RepID=UPI000C88436A|nr:MULTISPECIES: D-amino acid dehydrogenase [unclassified Pseudomonas]PMZ96091.1 amino acid dehydrogenase [Pseudomonas sp. FW305-42]PNA20224.1 amino acid dehydrogenase [Pseudomonas sp. MPR-R1B]PNB21206.1 amino acid dehydrogenase [Pseudomonas sp. DP16D-E2]PNB42560.1 amino acid dehydrogenase [Pseudomonas sp. FW305-17]PNB59329.1 amino acid dehydrogenase [Pseudomonas sp. GW531-E2]